MLLLLLILLSFYTSAGWKGCRSVRIRAGWRLSARKGVDSSEYAVAGKMRLALADLSPQHVLGAVCGKGISEQRMLFDEVELDPDGPMTSSFLIANPLGFLSRPELAKEYGCDLEKLTDPTDCSALAPLLPVIYVASDHRQYGTLGLQLNRLLPATLGKWFPSLRHIREEKVYEGGAMGKGLSFLMVHQITGIPGSRYPSPSCPSPVPLLMPSLRTWQVPSDREDMELFFSDDLAMANEFCSTGDAQPKDFKFFHWSTTWPPEQLANELEQGMWMLVSAPAEVIFADGAVPGAPLWSRIISSLSPEDEDEEEEEDEEADEDDEEDVT